MLTLSSSLPRQSRQQVAVPCERAAPSTAVALPLRRTATGRPQRCCASFGDVPGWPPLCRCRLRRQPRRRRCCRRIRRAATRSRRRRSTPADLVPARQLDPRLQQARPRAQLHPGPRRCDHAIAPTAAAAPGGGAAATCRHRQVPVGAVVQRRQRTHSRLQGRPRLGRQLQCPRSTRSRRRRPRQRLLAAASATALRAHQQRLGRPDGGDPPRQRTACGAASAARQPRLRQQRRRHRGSRIRQRLLQRRRQPMAMPPRRAMPWRRRCRAAHAASVAAQTTASRR